jgi:hypothetical protein
MATNVNKQREKHTRADHEARTPYQGFGVVSAPDDQTFAEQA